MSKNTLPYIEDYLEILAGYVGIRGRNHSFSLARYDVQIVQSMADQTTRGVAFTDRQALLAHKLVVKYKRQFAQNGLDIGYHEENGRFRNPVRIVDRSRTCRLENNQLVIRFPYNSEMIDTVRDSGKNVPGTMLFNKDLKAWVGAVTEPRLLWVKALSDKYQFVLDDQVSELIDTVEKTRNDAYVIELRQQDDKLEIVNAESSLLDYVNEHLGGFEAPNYLKLVDNSGNLGYSISNELLETIKKIYNKNQCNLLLGHREIHVPLSDPDGLNDILTYAQTTNRWPIVIFENAGEEKLKPLLIKYFREDEILNLIPRQRKVEVLAQHRCIYTNHWQNSWDFPVPLLLTMVAMMIGPKRQILLQKADKVVFCTEAIIKYDHA